MEIFLYEEGIGEELNVAEIARYLARTVGRVKIETRGSFFPSNLSADKVLEYAREFARIKIQALNQREQPAEEPLYGEIEYERRRISGKTRAFGVIYDGLLLPRLFRQMIPREEWQPDSVHILFTSRLFATRDESDRRFHLRTSTYNIPCLISTTGLVEAPAKPREYYLLKPQYERLGKDLTELKERFKGKFIDYGDERLTEITKGYAMQAVFYSLSGDPFCQDKGCRLYNAHWQEELIFAQLESGYEFCRQHAELLKKIQRN